MRTARFGRHLATGGLLALFLLGGATRESAAAATKSKKGKVSGAAASGSEERRQSSQPTRFVRRSGELRRLGLAPGAKPRPRPSTPPGSIDARSISKLIEKGEKLTFKVPKSVDAGNTWRASDGDTLVIDAAALGEIIVVREDGREQPVWFGKTHIPIRVAGEDTPELHVPDIHGRFHSQGPPAVWATQVFVKLLEGATVTIEPYQKGPLDKYGRLIGNIVVTRDGKRVDVDLEMVRAGAGHMYEIFGPDFTRARFDELSAASKDAVLAGRGVYDKTPNSQTFAEYSMCYRARVQSPKADDPNDQSWMHTGGHERYLADVANGLLYPPGHEYEPNVEYYNRLWINANDVQTARDLLHLKDAKITKVAKAAK
jgi:endonuclease YncB( thermonuclease family)